MAFGYLIQKEGGGHSAWSAPPSAVDADPDEAGALLDFHFTNPSAGSGRV
jgi:hypothetical protein